MISNEFFLKRVLSIAPALSPPNKRPLHPIITKDSFVPLRGYPDRMIRSVYRRLRHLNGAYYGRNNGRRNTVLLDAVNSRRETI